MISRTRRPRRHRPWSGKAEGPETEWFAIVPFYSDVPFHRPSNEDAVFGKTRAIEEAAHRNGKRTSRDLKPGLEYRIDQWTKPRVKRLRQGSAKYGDRK